MPERATSAAAALYPHLPAGTPAPVERPRRHGTVAEVMYPRPKPKPPNPYLEPMTEQAWREQLWAMAGLRRKR